MDKRLKLQALTSSAKCKLISDIDLYRVVHVETNTEVEELFLITTPYVNQLEGSIDLKKLLLSY